MMVFGTVVEVEDGGMCKEKASRSHGMDAMCARFDGIVYLVGDDE